VSLLRRTDPTVLPSTDDVGGVDGSYILEVIGARHCYGRTIAIDNVSIRVRPGQFLTLLGPSGSGKTTLLHIIAGLESPISIEALRIAGKDVRDLPAWRRNVTTVFQHYALFPHLSVGENIEYGLRVRGADVEKRKREALRLLELVRLPDMYDRRVHQLSGGERQRVSLARALAPQPAILLLDEPLGALDESLRLHMQLELHDLQRRLGITFVYVTHSQEEALTMSDRIILMARGRIVQSGSPHEMFDKPASRFAAGFMGVENILEGVVEASEGELLTLRIGLRNVRGYWRGKEQPENGARATALVRAEKVRLGVPAQEGMVNCFSCRELSAVYKGKYFDHLLDTPVGRMTARIWQGMQANRELDMLWWSEQDCAIVPTEAGESH
jgi:spermidine/putrescine transport system ATP-binding protein